MSIMSFNNIIIYLRKSRADDPTMTVEEVLAKHESILQDYCIAEFDQPMPESRIYREVVSGETIQDRPVMQRVLRLLESGNIDGVLVVEPQRLSRGDLEDCGHIINSFRYTNTAVITPTKTYNLQDEYDRKFFEMELTRGNDYLEYTKKILARGRLAAVMSGQYIGSVRPYGYNKVVYGSGKNKIRTLEKFKKENDVLVLMGHLYLDKDYTPEKIGRTLDDMGIEPPMGEHWSAITIRHLLTSPINNGKLTWNKRKTVIEWKDGKQVKLRVKNDEGDVIIVQGKHPATYDDETYSAIMAKMSAHSVKVTCKRELRNPLAGILFCQCGKSIVLKGKNTSNTLVLVCNSHSFCHTRSVPFNSVLAKVKGALSEAITDFTIKVSNKEETESELYALNVSALENKLKQLYKKDVVQKDAYEDGIYSKAEYIQRNAQLQEQIAATANTLKEMKANAPKIVSYEDCIVRFQDCLNALEDDSVSVLTKNTLLKACISKIVYHNIVREPNIKYGRGTKNSFSLEIFFKL